MARSFFASSTNTPAASFSFHCQICFEALHVENRPPVVLPCGHTFICAPCSKRLKRCTECRTDLFFTPPEAAQSPPPPPPEELLTWSSDLRRGARGGPPSPSPPPPRRPPPRRARLPTPRNVLLCSLLETAEREVRARRGPRRRASSECVSESSTEVAVSGLVVAADADPASSPRPSSDDEDDDSDFSDDDDRVLTGVGAMTSTCGTYAVADERGVLVLPRKPDDRGSRESSPRSSRDYDDDDAWRAPDADDAADDDVRGARLPYELEHGSRVQIVCVEDGWATLARGEGFLYVDDAQLVKVGGPADQACEIEGMLLSLRQAKADLDAQRENLDRVEHGMRAQLSRALRRPPPSPLPRPSPSLDDSDAENNHVDENHDRRSVDTPSTKKNDPPPPPPHHGTPCSSPDDATPSSSEKQRRTSLPLGDVPEDSPLPCRAIPGDARTPSPSAPRRVRGENPFRPPATTPAGDVAGLGLPRLSPGGDASTTTTTIIGPARTFPSSPEPSRPSSFARRRPRRAAAGRNAVDFRTGLSGHCALLSSKSHHAPRAHRPSVRTMGEHRGIGGNAR